MGGSFLVENPISTLMFQFPRFRQTLVLLKKMFETPADQLLLVHVQTPSGAHFVVEGNYFLLGTPLYLYIIYIYIMYTPVDKLQIM